MDWKKEFMKDYVSVVIPVYNGEGYLCRLLDSLLVQTYDKLEVILSDDGSEDRTLQVMEDYRQCFESKQIRYVILSNPHRNASAAISAGLKEVSGEYLIWPDADDELTPASVKKRVDFLKKHTEYHCVRSVAEYFDFESGEKVKAVENEGDLEPHKLFWDILEARTFVCCGCYMLKSSDFFRIYPDRNIPIYNVGQNFQMLLPYMYQYECPTIREALYRVNRRIDSHSARELTMEQELEKYREYEELIDEISGICGIKSKTEKNRIISWKAERKCSIGRKNHLLGITIKGYYALFRVGNIGFLTFVRRIMGTGYHALLLKR